MLLSRGAARQNAGWDAHARVRGGGADVRSGEGLWGEGRVIRSDLATRVQGSAANVGFQAICTRGCPNPASSIAPLVFGGMTVGLAQGVYHAEPAPLQRRPMEEPVQTDVRFPTPGCAGVPLVYSSHDNTGESVMKIIRIALVCLTALTAGGVGFGTLSIVSSTPTIAGCSRC